MSPDSIYGKSPKGLEEIETRAYKLGSRLRMVLIRVDGAKTVDELVSEAGDMGETLLGQLDELVKQGFLDLLVDGEAALEPEPEPEPEPAPAPPPPKPQASGKPAHPAAVKPEPPPVAAPAPKPAAPSESPKAAEPAAPAEAVEFNSPLKFRLQDLMIEAMGMETGKVGVMLSQCRSREDLTRWVDYAYGHIEKAAGKPKAKTFYKNARKLVG
jgi:hypothetical protein